VLVAPVSVSFGNGLQVGGIVANLLAEPCVLPATVSGLLAAVAGLVSPQLAAIVVLPGCWATAWIAGVARWIAHSFPPTPWAGGVQGAALMLILVCSGGAALVFAPTPRVRRLCFGIIAVGLLLLMAVPTPIGTPLTLSTSWPPAGWQVIMCDVGQGDSLLIRVDQTSAVAVDTGPDPTAESRCLHRAGISNIPLVILTHFHADHVEGLPGLMSVAHPALVLESPLAEPVGEAHRVHLWAHDAGMHERPAAPGDVFQVGPVRMRVVWPRRILRGVGSDPNNASVTIVATVSGIRLLLGGDLETAAQQEVLASGEVGSVDVVKVPHHGSAKQSPEWAELTRPKIALIGVGLNNDYGHPWPGTVAAYQRIGSAVGRTDLDGDLAVLRDQNGQLRLLHRSSWG
jgi:competence protein ComEC